MCFQQFVLLPEYTQSLEQWLRALPRKHFISEESNGRLGLRKVQPLSHRYINPHDSWFPVDFDSSGHVLKESITIPFINYENFETLQKTVSVALTCMAVQHEWWAQTRQMSMSIMQHYQVALGTYTKAIPWHRDTSDNTLVILLSDDKKWHGGDFLFKTNNGTKERFYPKQGYGIYFSNSDTQHSVEPWTAVSDYVDRTILTIHERYFPSLG